jgi:carbonic anhydrase
MDSLPHLFENNRHWAAEMEIRHPGFFQQLSNQQFPEYLWIGCSDSRVPANEIVNLMPGELFVHRNVANLVVHTDLNCLSVVQYAVDVLKVKHIIVCGHYGCGGVQAALTGANFGLIDNWLRNVQDVYEKHRDEVDALPTDGARLRRLCELNVTEQVMNLARTTVVQSAWSRAQALTIHAWIYGLKDGLLTALQDSINLAVPV